jgi:hypothetical protein
MRFAIIENGKVTNVAVSDAPIEANWIASETAKIGDEYKNGAFVTPGPDLDAESKRVRAERNKLLSECDWTQVNDAPVDQVAWAAYRQALRDIPSQAGFPLDVSWPETP